MGKTYDQAVAATTKSLPAYIDFKKKTLSNEKGYRERNLRLTRHEIDQAVMAAARNALTQDRNTISRLIAEEPGFLSMDLENIQYSTIWDELVYGISKSIVSDIEPKVRKAYEDQFRKLDIDGFVEECNEAVAAVRELDGMGLGFDTSAFEKAVADLAEDPCYGTIITFGGEIHTVINGLDRGGRRESSRRLMESGYFVLDNSTTDRFTREPPAPARARGR